MLVYGRTPSPVALALGIPPASGGGWQDALLECARTAGNPIDFLVAYPGSDRGRTLSIGGVEFRDIGPLDPPPRVARITRRWFPRGLDRRCLRECAETAAAWHPDVVHFHGTESGLGLAASMMGPPSVISIQGILSVLEGALVSAERASPARFLTSPGELVRGLSPWHYRRWMHVAADLERQMLHGCQHVAGRTEFDRRVTSVLAPQARYWHVGEVLRDAFTTAARWAPRTNYGEGCSRVCINGSSFELKGLRVAIDAVRILLEAGRDVHLEIIGIEGNVPTGRTAAAHARSLGVDDRIALLGNLAADRVADELLGVDVYIHPSLVDNSPNALCEAMALGVPCVASTAGGIPSLATDGQDALLVPPGDAFSLAGAIGALLASRDTALGLSDAARRSATARHDRAVVMAQLVAMYEQIVRERGTSTPVLHGGSSLPRKGPD